MDNSFASYGAYDQQQPYSQSIAMSAYGSAAGGGPASPPPGGRYQDSYTNPATGGVVDRYVVQKQSTVPVRSVVPEVQQYQVQKQVQVPETREVQVPMQRMVPQEETVMVPRIKMVQVQEMVPERRTKMVPQQYTAIQQVQTTKTVNVTQPMQRTISKVIEGQKIVAQPEIIEYERPRMIPGRYIGTRQMNAQEMGVQWTNSYYQQQPQQQVYTQPTTQIYTQPTSQMYTQPTQIQYVTSQQPSYAYSPPAQYSMAPQIVTQPTMASYSAMSTGYAVGANEADFEGSYYQQPAQPAQQAYNQAEAAGTVI